MRWITFAMAFVGLVPFVGCTTTAVNITTDPGGAQVNMLVLGRSELAPATVEFPDEYFGGEEYTVNMVNPQSSKIPIDLFERSIPLDSDTEDEFSTLDLDFAEENYDNIIAMFKKMKDKQLEIVHIKKSGYMDQVRHFLVPRKKTTNLDLIKLEKLDTEVSINTVPPGAKITFYSKVDASRLKGLPPLPEKATAPFTYLTTRRVGEDINSSKTIFSIEDVVLEGYKITNPEILNEVLLEPGTKKQITVILEPIVTTLRIMTEPDGATVEDFTPGGFGFLGESPITRNFTYKDTTIWAENVNVERENTKDEDEKRRFEAIELNLRISKPGYKDIFMKQLKVPIGSSRVFKRDLSRTSSQVNFSTDPEGAHVYIRDEIEADVLNEKLGKIESKTVKYKKHLGKTPFTYNVEPSNPLKHNEELIFEMSEYESESLYYAEGQNHYHMVLGVIEEETATDEEEAEADGENANPDEENAGGDV